jgi:hypothetical protein
MDADYSFDDLLSFLEHATERGLMPAATARAMAVASRQVFALLTPEERADLRHLDLEGTLRRFEIKRAKDFNPTSLKEYGRRAGKAVKLFIEWRTHPAGFSVKTRASSAGRRRSTAVSVEPLPTQAAEPSAAPAVGFAPLGSGHQTSLLIRKGHVVTLTNIPTDFTKAEAERLAQFVRLLAVE